jgi:hypothetical protein
MLGSRIKGLMITDNGLSAHTQKNQKQGAKLGNGSPWNPGPWIPRTPFYLFLCVNKAECFPRIALKAKD